ncbi:cytochrome c oxidase subunit 2 [Limimonas halophila]|uniref:Cytochrome c oxidase subunit 2 n=1 Tax=Limimonas halophila TaxID=1082479 RepID=A0A1G7V3E9_9PROT|nr:cytochrome c oxidase subunit II [Limimonas halophila]SDG54342.1 cytochrome c oxidase subunit 2 [Limimonas halophila]
MQTRTARSFGMKHLAALGAGSAALGTAAGAAAREVGKPEPWQLGFQEAATPMMEQVQSFHTMLLVIITGIVIFVVALLGYVCWRFSERRNKEPSERTENTLIEVLWTTIPVIILVVIAIPSFKLLYYRDHVPNAEFSVKTIGKQWYWAYEYPDHGGFSYNSFMKEADEIDPSEGELRKLSVTEPIVIPADTTVRFLITSTDVLHSFALPSFGIKQDAIPGEMNQTWARVDEPGIYYGQCSELCGVGHANMPIAVKVVPKDEFRNWIETKKAEAGVGDDERELAQADSGQ